MPITNPTGSNSRVNSGPASPGDEWRAQVRAIAADRVSGASSVAVNLTRALVAFAADERKQGIEHLRRELLGIARIVLAGQPSMAGLVRILNDAALALEQARTADEGASALDDLCRQYEGHISTASRKIARHALAILSPGTTALTLSHSSVVAEALLAAHQGHAGALHVICLESRPALEGRALAARLAQHNVRVTLVVDAAAADLMQHTSAWLVGADSLTDKGVINKTGTSMVAACAATWGVPGYVLGDTSKVRPAQLPTLPFADHDPAEIWHTPPEGIEVQNRYFDLTPWAQVSAVVSERGPVAASQIQRLVRSIAVHEGLAAVLSGMTPHGPLAQSHTRFV